MAMTAEIHDNDSPDIVRKFNTNFKWLGELSGRWLPYDYRFLYGNLNDILFVLWHFGAQQIVVETDSRWFVVVCDSRC
jgi:glutathionyl-hydroquinone reductase